jgi:hypothetical protein
MNVAFHMYDWNQYFISEKWLNNSVKTCLQDQFHQTWHANIDTGSKTLNYRLFKNKFEFENYFNIPDDRDIFTFCRFRLNNHKLPVEYQYGRWNNIPRENRICNLCNTVDLGDELHYLLKCVYFSEKRKACIDKKKKTLKIVIFLNLALWWIWQKIKNKKTLHLYKIYNVLMKMSVLMAEKSKSLSLSHFVNIVYTSSCFLIMYCIVSYCVLCMYLICYLYTIILTKVTRNKIKI